METNKNKSKSALVVWMAKGGKVTAWCRKSGVPIRTARFWTADPKFRARVESARHRMYERSLGVLAASMAKMAAGMVKLGVSAEAEAVRLQAQRAVFAEARDTNKFLLLERELAEIKERLDADDRKSVG